MIATDIGGNSDQAPVPLAVSSEVCERFLDLTPGEYMIKASGLNKKEAKELKNNLCMRFQKFCGKVTVRAQTSNRSSQSNLSSPQPTSQKSQLSSVAMLSVVNIIELKSN